MTANDPARPATEGGERVRTAPWPARHHMGEAERRAVLALFDHSEYALFEIEVTVIGLPEMITGLVSDPMLSLSLLR